MTSPMFTRRINTSSNEHHHREPSRSPYEGSMYGGLSSEIGPLPSQDVLDDLARFSVHSPEFKHLNLPSFQVSP